MKTIIAPTDFSEAASNAVDYASEIANVTGAKLILLHAYHPPLITSDIPVVMPSMEEIAEAALQTLKKTELMLRDRYNNRFAIECVVKCGFAGDETEQLSNDSKADLIVMGMRGAGLIEEKLIGSVTTSVMNRVKTPLLVIDSKIKYKPIRNIAFAADYEEIRNKEILQTLKYFANLFSAKIHVVNVIRSAEKLPHLTEAVAGVHLSSSLQDIDHDFSTIENEDVVEGINDFTIHNNIDLVVMMPRKHSLFNRIFTPSKTKKMAFHAHAPLMCIHE